MNSQQFLLQTDDEIMQQLAKQAQELRIKKNLTQKDFAKKAGISYGTYIKFERLGSISLQSFLKVLRYLGRLKNIADLLKVEDIQKLGIEEYAKNITTKESKRVSKRNK